MTKLCVASNNSDHIPVRGCDQDLCFVNEFLRLREAQSLAPGHTAGKRTSRGAYRGLPGSSDWFLPQYRTALIGEQSQQCPQDSVRALPQGDDPC